MLGIAAAATVTLVIFGLVQFRLARELDGKMRSSQLRREEAAAKIAELEAQLRAASARAKATEGDNAILAAAIEKAQAANRAAGPAAPAPVTDEVVRSRFARAQELARNGDPQEALRELLWCFDEGMLGRAGFNGVRSSYVLRSIRELGQRNPAALAALRERRDRARQHILSGGGNGVEIPDFVALNRVLEEPAFTLTILDQLPAGDRRRQTLAIYATELLIENRRYQDALAARPYATMSSQLERAADLPAIAAGAANPAQALASFRESTIRATLNNIEVLAGVGDIAHARTLAERLLAYDNTENTRTRLQQHAVRAGQPDLFAERAP
jgi:hypothetical protein